MRHVAVLLLSGALVTTVAGQQRESGRWPRFRGPNGSGVADADKPPVTFGPADHMVWKTSVPPGHSSPIVWDDHIFLTGLDSGSLVVLALDRNNGSIRWRHTVPAMSIEKVHSFSSPAAPTPATDGQHVYVYFGSYGLLAYDFSGNVRWQKPLPTPPTAYGTATSPIVFNGRVILQRDGNDGESELLALEAATGNVAWRTPRPLLREAWSTPIIWNREGDDEIVTSASNRVVAYAARSGEERWWSRGLSIAPITVPVIGNGLLFASATYSGSPSDPIVIPEWNALVGRYDADKDGNLGITEVPRDQGIHTRPDVPKETPGAFLPLPAALRFSDGNKDGIVTKTEWDATLAFVKANEDNVIALHGGGLGDVTGQVVWKASRGISELPSPLFYRGRLYFVRNGGLVTSYSPENGAIVLDRQRLGALGLYVASPIAADGRIYASSQEGTIVVFRAADTLDVLARNDLGDTITATPAIAADRLYVRTAKHLWAFGR